MSTNIHIESMNVMYVTESSKQVLGSIFARMEVWCTCGYDKLIRELKNLGFVVQHIDNIIFAVGDGIYLRLNPSGPVMCYDEEYEFELDVLTNELYDTIKTLWNSDKLTRRTIALILSEFFGMYSLEKRIKHGEYDFIHIYFNDEKKKITVKLKCDRPPRQMFHGIMLMVLDTLNKEHSEKVLKLVKVLEKVIGLKIEDIERERSM